MTTQDKLEATFSTALVLGPDTDFGSLAYGASAEWDSMAHMALVAEIEQAFDVMLSTDDVIGMSSFLRAKELLANHGLQFGPC